jgi:hypothetical protein
VKKALGIAMLAHAESHRLAALVKLAPDFGWRFTDAEPRTPNSEQSP